MSIGRPDPNALNTVAPDVYHRNLAEIARAKAAIEAFEQMNERGKSNYDRIAEQEERELEEKIQEGLLAKQRLQELRNRRTTGLLESGSRIEEVGSTNTSGYDSVRHPGHSAVAPSTSFVPPVQNVYTQQSQATVSPVANNPLYYPSQYAPSDQVAYAPNQNPSDPYNARPVQSTTQNGSTQRSNINQTYYPRVVPVQSNNVQISLDTSNNNQQQPAQTSGSHYRPRTQFYNANGSNYSQNSSGPSNSTTINPHVQRQSYSELHYQQQLPHTNNGTSSLVGALGAVSSSNPPSVVTNATQTSNAQTMASVASSTIPPIASSSRPARSRSERISSKTKASWANATQEVIIPHRPTREQVVFFKNYFNQWAAHSPQESEYPAPITCDKYSIKCQKYPDGSPRFVFKLPTGVVHIPASNFLDGLLSTVARPVDHPASEPQATIPSKPLLTYNELRGNKQSSASTTLNQGQGVSAPVSGKETEPSSSSIPSQASVSTPQTPVQRAPLERRVGTITSPQQADKKRIAQSVLFALGKRRRGNDNLPEAVSQVSKKQALGTTVNGKPEDIPSRVESSKGDSTTGSSHKPTITGSVEPKPTNSIPPEASTETTTATSVSEALPQNDVTVVASAMPKATVTFRNIPHHPHQPYGQLSSTNSLPTFAPQQIQYVNFTPLNPNSAWKPPTVPAPSYVGPPPAIPEKTLDTARQNIPSSTTSRATSLSVKETSKSNVLNNKRPAPTSGSMRQQKESSTPQASLPAPTQSSSSVKKSTTAVPTAGNRADTLIPEIAYLETRSPLPVASSSKLPPPKDPLFLPSPSAEAEGELWAAETAGTNLDGVVDTQLKESVARPTVNRAYVLVPPAPEYLVQYRRQKQKRAESRLSSASSGARRRNGTWTDSSVSTPFGEEDFSFSVEGQLVSVLEEQEREAIQLSCSRLGVVPCRWDGCDVELNSVEGLIRHLNIHKPTATQQTNTFMCRWTQCGQQGIKLEDVHLEKHALLPLRCAYLGCDHTFRSASQLLRHSRTRHSGDELKPSAKLAPPSTLPDLPPIPGTIPSYLIVTSLAGHEVLSKERHNIIEPQVLRGMTTEENAPTRRSRKNARPASRPALPVTRTDLTNDYHFLENNNSARSSTYFSKASDFEYSDLDSDSLMKIVERGIVLLGSNGDTDVEVDNDDNELVSSPSSPLQRRETHGEVEVKPGLEKEPGGVGSAVRQDEHSSDEDAAVETMLTDMTSMGTSTS